MSPAGYTEGFEAGEGGAAVAEIEVDGDDGVAVDISVGAGCLPHLVGDMDFGVRGVGIGGSFPDGV